MQRIAILAFNTGEGGGITSLNNLIKILEPITAELHLICTVDKLGNNPFPDLSIHKSFLTHKGGGYKLKRIFNVIWTQIRMSYILLRIMNHIDLVYFIDDTLTLPALVSKMFNKQVIMALISSKVQIFQAVNDSFHQEIKLITQLNYKLSDLILLYSPSLIREWSLDKYQDKIYFIQEHFLDFTTFKIQKRFRDRKNIIGYIGRLSREKGVMELVQGIPAILEGNDAVGFMIGGTGPLENLIRTELEENNLTGRVELTGWISPDDFVDFLNKLKLLVIPSETEGLPYIILESMACGTPVLARNVGSIPDLITDGVNGFIMEDNSVESIKDNINRVLEFPELDKIAGEARSFVEENFTYQTAVEKYKSMLEKIQ